MTINRATTFAQIINVSEEASLRCFVQRGAGQRVSYTRASARARPFALARVTLRLVTAASVANAEFFEDKPIAGLNGADSAVRLRNANEARLTAQGGGGREGAAASVATANPDGRSLRLGDSLQRAAPCRGCKEESHWRALKKREKELRRRKRSDKAAKRKEIRARKIAH